MNVSRTLYVCFGTSLLVVSARGFVQAPTRCIMNYGTSPQTLASVRSSRPALRPRASVSTLFLADKATPAESSAVTEEGPAAPPSASAATVEEEPAKEREPEEPLTEAQMARAAKLEEIERLRAAEKFITQPTGDYECLQCSFVYRPFEEGQGALSGTQFEDLPSSWLCPVCKAPKETFVAQTKTIAGFEENFQYGFGANTMTPGQKNALIFGSLAAFFLLFLGGYLLE